MFKGFTLIELIVVVIIVGIVAGFAVPPFMVTQERARDSEARSTLGFLWAAQRAYRMEESNYYPPSGPVTVVGTINRDLKLSLPVGSAWAYRVELWGAPDLFRCTATRTGGPRTPRAWRVSAASDIPTCTGAGCFP